MISAEINTILEKYPNARREDLIPILQDVQELQGFISKDIVITIGRHLELPASKIYGVATFYNQFRFQARGQYIVQVCRGTACHVKGSADVLDAIVRELQVSPGETTRDGLFSLEVVACIGACGLAPVISVDGEFFAGVDQDKVAEIIAMYRRKAENNGSDE